MRRLYLIELVNDFEHIGLVTLIGHHLLNPNVGNKHPRGPHRLGEAYKILTYIQGLHEIVQCVRDIKRVYTTLNLLEMAAAFDCLIGVFLLRAPRLRRHLPPDVPVAGPVCYLIAIYSQRYAVNSVALGLDRLREDISKFNSQRTGFFIEGLDYIIKRHKMYASRMNESIRNQNSASEYWKLTEDDIRKDFNIYQKTSNKVI